MILFYIRIDWKTRKRYLYEREVSLYENSLYYSRMDGEYNCLVLPGKYNADSRFLNIMKNKEFIPINNNKF